MNKQYRFNMILKFLPIFIFSIIFCNELDPLDILEKSIHRLDSTDINFFCNIKQQSLSNDPVNFTLSLSSYRPYIDSLTYYNYIKFHSPIDYKDVEVLAKYHNDDISLKKKIPINNEITDINNNSDNANVISLFNFIELLREVKSKKLLLKSKKINQIEVHFIKAYSEKSKKKSIKFYIDKENYAIYKIEWTDKKGRVMKTLLFENWSFIDNIYFSSKIIYEDIKQGTKITCDLSKIKFKKSSKEIIDLIESIFNVK